MKVPIAAASGFAHLAPETRDSLRDTLRAVCPSAPRRLNRLTELSLIGAYRCVGDRRPPADTALYLGCTSGCVADSASLVRSVVHGQSTMPLDFINVSSNIAGFHIAASLGLHSSNHVVASRDFGWESALELALLGEARRFLVGAIEEAAWPLEEHRERLGLSRGEAILETSQWLWCDLDATTPIATIEWLWHVEHDNALAALVASRVWPTGTSVYVVGAMPEAALHVDLPLADGLFPDGHTGMAGAAGCVRFIERGEGSLLYLSRGRAGRWRAAFLSTSPAAAS